METILLVYNDRIFAKALDTFLAENGYDVISLYDAERVKESAENHRPGLIILDALLQKMNGFELCQALKRSPRLSDIPIMMTSAIYISEDDLKNGMYFGETMYTIMPDKCLMKPFALPDLLKHIRFLLKQEVETPSLPKVLIVDDEKNIRNLLRTTLKQYHYQPLEASTGQACLDLLSSTIPNVILLDYKLPDLSGIDVLKQIRKTHPDIGMVLMTAYGDEELAIHAIEEHVDAYIRKPFLIESILALVAQTLERNQIKMERNRLVEQLRESNREVMQNYIELEQANRRLRELDQLKSEFLANVGHELRTPLNSIIGFTELILQGYSGPLNENQHRQLSMVLDSGNHLLRVLNDVIEVSMLNAGQIVLQYESVKIADIIADVLHEFKRLAAQKQLHLLVTIDPNLPDCFCNREKIRLILYNLLDNAIKFSSVGEVVISAVRVSLHTCHTRKPEHIPDHLTSNNEYLEICVRDQGIGIHEKNFDILFDEFRQVDGSLTREYSGTGLGLAISKKLVELYGGKIWLESRLGFGTEFYFTVPLCETK
ncbi:hypothetical protein CSA56_13650 [candidate division KSB3 bacterium]|uniref:histidine kinase n=1 Tax=candidate division KSB3 bacterium TaxID=2044937 RepID=A0A2G6KBC9_9BACT|nr:MAG: hypothetical protein CSA56_13650 [candidate division KSB3 bacterium]